MICKLSAVVEKQEKAMEVLTAKIIHLESTDNDNGERLNNHSYHLGILELPQQVRELRSNPFVLDLILPHLSCSCSISLGVWCHAVFSRMASSSSFAWLASCVSRIAPSGHPFPLFCKKKFIANSSLVQILQGEGTI
jgi:hypothetical protein